MTMPGQYDFLLEQIEALRYRLTLDPSRGEVPYEEAATAWYDRVYRPLVRLIQLQGLERLFPEITDTDLYVVVLRRRAEMEEALDWSVDMTAVAADLAKDKESGPAQMGEQMLQAVTPEALGSGPPAGRWRRDRLEKRPGGSVFSDILVAGRGVEADLNMLRHAAIIAQREDARLLALRVLKDEADLASDWLVELQDIFEEFRQEMELRGQFAAEMGPVAQTIVRRAALTDLVALSLVRHTGPETATGFGTRFNKILQSSPRPVLVVPEDADSAMDRALLAYDGSPKADEALYLAAYMARNWQTELVVMAAGKKARAALGRAKAYLSAHDVQATYVRAHGPAHKAILDTAEEQGANMLVMGGFGQRSALQMVVGSTVNRVLRATRLPVFVCR
jgi:nucleotide-binding universal stress UspA family protein